MELSLTSFSIDVDLPRYLLLPRAPSPSTAARTRLFRNSAEPDCNRSPASHSTASSPVHPPKPTKSTTADALAPSSLESLSPAHLPSSSTPPQFSMIHRIDHPDSVSVTLKNLPLDTLAELADVCRELGVKLVTFKTPEHFPVSVL
ncbi:hypothetical protein FA95DRAFT_1679861 [Auriscalpium vulgare]|uniref:Uncharacterized protein n=1 Tax=Auriscalpium vulgare TaxID=40419 RepID=A0ACB8RRR9_9AGAM|nr:hypothetical protein FA95DRAFT_1679861 [Auriscalpium vulgare]